jgi:hypothetical protein
MQEIILLLELRVPPCKPGFVKKPLAVSATIALRLAGTEYLNMLAAHAF